MYVYLLYFIEKKIARHLYIYTSIIFTPSQQASFKKKTGLFRGRGCCNVGEKVVDCLDVENLGPVGWLTGDSDSISEICKNVGFQGEKSEPTFKNGKL